MDKKNQVQKNSFRAKYIRHTIFAVAILILPLAWWAFSFFYTTGDTILLAFKEWDIKKEAYFFCNFDNFIEVIEDMTLDGGILNISFKNSFTLWIISTFITLPISVIISFALHKRIYCVGAFKIILFLPHIVSGMVWTIIYKYIVEYGVPAVMGIPSGQMTSLLNTPPQDLGMLILYQQWLGLAGNMVIYTGAMSRVPPSLVEAGQLDGMGSFREFTDIVIPLIFPTLSVVLITCVVGIFTASLPTYQFYGSRSGAVRDGLYTFGYYTFVRGLGQSPTQIPAVSALSIIVCVLATPITLLVRWLLEKFGPTVEY